MNEKIELSETEEKLYNFIKETGSVKMFDIINHEDKRLIGAVGKLKSKELIEIIRKPSVEEPRKEYRKIVTLRGPLKEHPIKVLESVVAKNDDLLRKLNTGSKKIRTRKKKEEQPIDSRKMKKEAKPSCEEMLKNA